MESMGLELVVQASSLITDEDLPDFGSPAQVALWPPDSLVRAYESGLTRSPWRPKRRRSRPLSNECRKILEAAPVVSRRVVAASQSGHERWHPPFAIREDDEGAVVVDSYVSARQDPILLELALLLYGEGLKHVLRAGAIRNGLRQEMSEMGYTRLSALRDADLLVMEHKRIQRRLSRERRFSRGDQDLVFPLAEDICNPKYSCAAQLLETMQDHEKAPVRRLREADAMEKKGRGLQLKAQRQANCGIYARQYDGTVCGQPRYKPFRCKNRYCPRCAPKIFESYIENYSLLGARIDSFLAGQRSFLDLTPGEKKALAGYEGQFRLRILDITTRSGSEMPSPEDTQRFEKDVKQLQRRIAKHLGLPARLVPYLYCDEFGHNNTNLHCHGIFRRT